MAASKNLEKLIAIAEKDFERAHEELRKLECAWLDQVDELTRTHKTEIVVVSFEPGSSSQKLREAIRDYRQKLSALVALDEQADSKKETTSEPSTESA